MIVIYTDGACSGNPGPGGFGVVVYENNSLIKRYQKFFSRTTNNAMELSAIIWALENFGKSDIPPIVYSDSMYAVNTFNTWMWNWKQNGWTRSKGQKVENLDLIKKYDKLIQDGYRIDLMYVKGHAGNEGNEQADDLATGRILIQEEKDGE